MRKKSRLRPTLNAAHTPCTAFVGQSRHGRRYGGTLIFEQGRGNAFSLTGAGLLLNGSTSSLNPLVSLRSNGLHLLPGGTGMTGGSVDSLARATPRHFPLIYRVTLTQPVTRRPGHQPRGSNPSEFGRSQRAPRRHHSKAAALKLLMPQETWSNCTSKRDTRREWGELLPRGRGGLGLAAPGDIMFEVFNPRPYTFPGVCRQPST